jgi:hypothetical protein
MTLRAPQRYHSATTASSRARLFNLAGSSYGERSAAIADMPKYAIDVAIGGKADMGWCTAHVCF